MAARATTIRTDLCPTGKTPAGSVNLSRQKHSALPKFGNDVCVAHPGSTWRGDRTSSLIENRVLRWTRQRRRERCGQGGSPREPETARRRTALKARLANIFPATCTCRKTLWRHAGRCVRQNRVVLAVVATAKPREDATSPTGGSASSIREATGAKGHRSPGTLGISRQPIAQGRPDVRPTCMLLCAHFSTLRAADRGCQPAPGLPCAFLDQEGGETSKARAKPAARMRRRVCE